jgi:hypothetical protein
MRADASLFLSGFKTKTDDPFGELRLALTEYNRLTAEIVAKRNGLERLESQISLGEGSQRDAMAKISAIDANRRETEEKIAGLERVKIFSPDGPSDYMRPVINKMSEESFEKFVDFQMKNAERPDLIGAGSHTVDIVRVHK